MTPNEILLKAVAYIEENGWYQGDYIGPDGKCACAMGAINKVCHAVDNGWDLYTRSIDILGNYAQKQGLVEEGWSIAQYNDKASTTKEDILRVMREAAAA